MTPARSYFYYNLHQSCWSEMLRGKVVGHVQGAVLYGVEFRVRPGGRERVLREQRKNVHAFAVADSFGRGVCRPGNPAEWVEVTYSPFRGATFTRKDTGAPVGGAARVILTADRKVFAQGLR